MVVGFFDLVCLYMYSGAFIDFSPYTKNRDIRFISQFVIFRVTRKNEIFVMWRISRFLVLHEKSRFSLRGAFVVFSCYTKKREVRYSTRISNFLVVFFIWLVIFAYLRVGVLLTLFVCVYCIAHIWVLHHRLVGSLRVRGLAAIA